MTNVDIVESSHVISILTTKPLNDINQLIVVMQYSMDTPLIIPSDGNSHAFDQFVESVVENRDGKVEPECSY